MLPIKCTEKDCPEYITNPCGDVIANFNLRFLLENRRNKLKNFAGDDNLRAQIKRANDRLSDLGLQNVEKAYQDFVGLRNETIPAAPARVFILECILGHRHSYTIDCSTDQP